MPPRPFARATMAACPNFPTFTSSETPLSAAPLPLFVSVRHAFDDLQGVGAASGTNAEACACERVRPASPANATNVPAASANVDTFIIFISLPPLCQRATGEAREKAPALIHT